jgi:hypothetical protein
MSRGSAVRSRHPPGKVRSSVTMSLPRVGMLLSFPSESKRWINIAYASPPHRPRRCLQYNIPVFVSHWGASLRCGDTGEMQVMMRPVMCTRDTPGT